MSTLQGRSERAIGAKERCFVFALCASPLLPLASLAFVAPPAAAAEIKGTIVSVLEASKDKFVVAAGRRKLTFQLDRDGKVLIENKVSSLGDMVPDDNVTVVYER